METEYSKSNISNKDTDTLITKNCSYCNKPFTEEVWCKECINSLEKLAENDDKEAMFNIANKYEDGEGTEMNIEKAFYWYQKAAERDHIDAMFIIANKCEDGEGTEKNLEKAFYWYQKAAEKDHIEAMYNLASSYYSGEGTEKNFEKAFYWYQKAAENGDTDAMNNLAICYMNGKGTEINLEKAFYLYQKAAESGDTYAMNNLAICYENGEGTEKNLEKTFYWYQKSADNGDEIAMNNLGICYNYGEGTEKNLEKAFYWYQKAAENGYEKAMLNLARSYYRGIGTEKNLEKVLYWYQKAAENGNEEAMLKLATCFNTGNEIEKNLEKAFYWHQKAAENGNEKAMNNLACNYYNGEGTEKCLEKAFYWYQEAAENGHTDAMNHLANRYFNGEGTKKNFGKAFYWYQKAAESGCTHAKFNLATCYRDGLGTEKNLEKSFYWHQKVAENNKVNFKNEVGLCNECKQPYTDYQWCQQCNAKRFQKYFSNWTSKNELADKSIFQQCFSKWTSKNEFIFQWYFSKWTSKNEFIDKFIQEAQINAKNSYEILEWIPYNKLSSINYYDKGGFSEVYKAVWSEGPIYSWNFYKRQWNRCNLQTGYEVILKSLNNSSSLNNKFLDEWKYHYNCQKKSFSKFIQFFGFTQDPNNLNYIIVMSFAKKGSLRKCLPDIIKFTWQDKLQLLKKIILGLKVIHESNLTHGDFHDGNILMSDNYNEIFIIDLGLCKPISDLQDSDSNDNEIYGVLPYMAPEILRRNPYTLASDIYSFSMIMWEFTSGIPPFDYEAHDHHLILSVCEEGKRPEIIKNSPECYVELMKKCWDSDPSNRPTATTLEYIISEWIECINGYYIINRDGDYNNVVNIDNQKKDDVFDFVRANRTLVQKQADTSIIQSHPQAYYTSRKLTEIYFQEESQDFDCMIKD